MSNKGISGVIFDYGGTLDTRGDHWSEVIWDAYIHEELPVNKQSFRDAYVYGERALAANDIVKPHFHFRDVLRAKLMLQLGFLSGRKLLPTGKDDAERQRLLASLLELSDRQLETQACSMAGYIDDMTARVLAENRHVLQSLRDRGVPMALVSNFYGNISTILADAGIGMYFKKVIESAVVGVRKPDPAIFALGVRALGLPASRVLVVGDSYGKDIAPAYSIGCHTIWIKGRQWNDSDEDVSICDAIVNRLADILPYIG